MSSILEKCGHEVEWVEPSIHTKISDVERFDVVLLGISPALSVTSNKAYGVLSMIDLLKDDPRLRFFIDAPEPGRITANLRAVEKDFSQMTKSFYSLRRQYKEVVSSKSARSAIAGGVNHLAASEWPLTVYPAMPWSDDSEVASKLPAGAANSIVGITVDPYYVSSGVPSIESEKVRRWVVDTDKGKWTVNTLNSLSLPHSKMKEGRSMSDGDVLANIVLSIGSIIGPGVDGALWWSHRWAQSLNALTPIASDWRVTSKVGQSWSHLAASIEEMSYIDMYELSISQRKEYLSSLPSQDNVREKLETTLGITNDSAV